MSGMRAFRPEGPMGRSPLLGCAHPLPTLHRFSLTTLLLLVSLLGFDITQPVEPSAAATSESAGLKSPSNANAVAYSESRINLSWKDNSTNETGFEVHRSGDGSNGVFTLVARTAADVTAQGDPGLNPSTQYCYKVRAFKTADGRTRYSDFSNTACATTLTPPPQAGSIRVTTETTGFDLDVNGYFMRVDGGVDQPIGTKATVTMADVAAGDHTLWLRDVAPNCSVDGANPRAVSVTGGATTEVIFTVTCGSGPTIEVTTVTTGGDLDADGYGVMLWRVLDDGSRDLVASASVAAKGTVRFFGLTTGAYEVEFNGVATNCVPISPNPLPVDLSYGGTVAVEFDVACQPISPGPEVCGNGLDDDGDGLTDGSDSDCYCDAGTCESGPCGQGYVCNEAACCVPHCGDGLWNGGEGDTDCGVVCSNFCANGQHCSVNGDCTSGSCVNSETGWICQ